MNGSYCSRKESLLWKPPGSSDYYLAFPDVILKLGEAGDIYANEWHLDQ